MKFNIVRPKSEGKDFISLLVMFIASQAKFVWLKSGNSRVEHPRIQFQRFLSRKVTERFNSDKEASDKLFAETGERVVVARLTHTKACEEICNGDMTIVSNELWNFTSKLARSIGFTSMLGDDDCEQAIRVLALDYVDQNPNLSAENFMEEAAIRSLRPKLRAFDAYKEEAVSTPLIDAIVEQVEIPVVANA
jgi:hypothetical protein